MNDSNLNNNETIILLLRQFVLKQIEKERKLTQNKINLLLKISLKEIFKFFSPSNDYISYEIIKNIFDNLDVDEIKKVFEIYDKDKDSFLNFAEFRDFIFPKYIEINIDDLREKNKNKIKNEKIDFEIKNAIYNLFQIEILNLNDSSEIIKKIINNINDSNNLNIYLYLFELIKGNDKNYDYLNEYITIDDLLKFLNRNSNSIKIYEQDIANFIFRYSYSNNSKLNIEEFTNMINFYLEFENKNKSKYKNLFNEFKTRNKFLLDYSSIDINNSNQNNNLNNHTSFRKTEFLSNHENNDDYNILMNTNKTCNNINYAIEYNERELRNLKIKSLTEFFKNIIKELDKLEINKIQFVQNVNSKELFSFFDLNDEGNVSKENFISVFNDNFNIKFNEEDFLYLITKYDINKDEKLNYEEFNNMIFPITKINLRKNEENIENKLKDINLYNEEQKNAISNLFLSLINCENSIYLHKKKLSETPLFTFYEMFEIIRNKDNKLLNSEDIFYFLKNQNVIIQNEQFDILLNYLFFTTEKNKVYNFIDFIKIIYI